MNEKIVSSYLSHIKDKFTYSSDELNSIRYSSLLLLGLVEKTLIIMLVFSLFGRTRDFLICYTVLVFLRTASGGLDFKNYWACLLFTLSFLIMSIIVLPTLNVSLMFYQFGALINLIITLVLAPVRPLTRPKSKKGDYYKFKIISAALIVVIFIIFFAQKNNSPIFWTVTLLNTQLIIAKGWNTYVFRKNKIICTS